MKTTSLKGSRISFKNYIYFQFSCSCWDKCMVWYIHAHHTTFLNFVFRKNSFFYVRNISACAFKGLCIIFESTFQWNGEVERCSLVESLCIFRHKAYFYKTKRRKKKFVFKLIKKWKHNFYCSIHEWLNNWV